MAKILVERGLSVDRLREVLDYNPETGVFTWKISLNRKIKVGSVAGCEEAQGYIAIKINGKSYKAHRLAWAHYYGEWPSEKIDHMFGIRSINKIAELRLATIKQNNENVKLKSNNKSGFRGVYWYKRYEKWNASVRHCGSVINLGYFDTPEEAAAVAKAKREELFSHYNGRDAA